MTQTNHNVTSSAAVQNEKLTPPQSPPPAPVEPKPKRKIPKPVVILGAIALLAGVGYGVYRLFFYHPQPDGLFLSGRIEGYETDVSAKIGGRVASVAVREGDEVLPNQLLAQIDDSDLQAQLRGAQARVRAAQERVRQSQQQLPILVAQLQQAKLTTQQAGQDSEGRVVDAQNAVAQSRANLAAARVTLAQAQTRQRRTAFLYEQGAIGAQALDDDNATVGVAQAQVAAAAQAVQSAQGRLTQAQATQGNTPIRAAGELQIQQQIAQANTAVSVAQQELQDAQATVAQIQANLNYLVIRSPMSGNVTTRSIEPGEVVAAGAPLLTLVNQNQLYLRGFVPEGEIGQVRVGQAARVYIDGLPNQPLEARVSRIDPKASFTPENTYFQDNRVTQVFGVELTLDSNAQGIAKQGMPADGRILVPDADHRSSSLPSLFGLISIEP